MGYKTNDVDEKVRLEKEGHKVIGLIGVPFAGPIYEFDFETDSAGNIPKAIKPPLEIPVKKAEEKPAVALRKEPTPVGPGNGGLAEPLPVQEEKILKPEKKSIKKLFKRGKK